MRHLVLFATFALVAAPAWAASDEPAPPTNAAADQVAKAPPQPVGPCAHGANRMMLGGVDPVEQSCALAIAGQKVAEQAQQIIVLQAKLSVVSNDLAAAQDREAEAAKAAKPAEPTPKP